MLVVETGCAKGGRRAIKPMLREHYGGHDAEKNIFELEQKNTNVRKE
jgi:hypothetical protein